MMTTMRDDTTSAVDTRLDSILVDVEADEGKFGPRFTWWFEANGQHGRLRLRTWTSRATDASSRAARYARSLGGDAAGGLTSVGALIGERCTLIVAANEAGYLVIKDVLPPTTP